MSEPIREYDPSEVPAAPSSQTGKPKGEGRRKANGPRRRKRPTHEQLVDNAREAKARRKWTTIETAESAVTIWKSVRLGRGPLPPDPIPTLADKDTLVGPPVDEQVARTVEQTPGFAEWRRGTLDGDAFLEELRPQFPQEYPHPWPGLCGAERQALGAEDLARAAGSTGLDEQEPQGQKGEGRLLGGMRHVDTP